MVEQVNSMDVEQLREFVDTLGSEQRKQLREQLREKGDQRYLLSSLWYNYQAQEWIE